MLRKVVCLALVITIAAGLCGTLRSGTVLAAGDSAGKLPEYEPMEIGDMFRMSPENLRDLKILPTDEKHVAYGSPSMGVTAVGEQKMFLIYTLTGYGLTNFTLRAVGAHAEVWVQNNLSFPQGDERTVEVTDAQCQYLVNQFDNVIYPVESKFFGSPYSHTGENSLLVERGYFDEGYYEPSDGVERVIILVSNIRDENYRDPTYPNYIAGFFSSAFTAYFDRNVVTIDSWAWGNRLGGNDSPWRPDDGTQNDRPYLYEGVLAHEYQHLLHNDFDPDEDTWINEGMSDFAEYLTGYTDLGTDSHIAAYLSHPYNSLVAWEDQGGLEVLSDYGAAYLMQLYLNHLYGSAFIQALAMNPLNGIASVNDTLARMKIKKTFSEIYRDWTVTNLINSGKPGNNYSISGLNRRIVLDNEGDSGPEALAWGPGYHRLPSKPRVTGVTIEGIPFMPLTWSVVDDPTGPDDTNKVLYSNGGNLANNTIILPVDLTGSTRSVLRFKTLYDIEEFWDFAFVQVSTDNGKTWVSLANEYTGSDHDPSAHPDIVANLPGLTGVTEGWTDMEFNLSAYDGQEILLAFRYMTDWASQGNGELDAPGWYVDDISVGSVGLDGASLEPFVGPDKVAGRLVEYMISFAGKTKGGKGWQVMHIPTQNFGLAEQVALQKFLKNPALEEIVMIVSHAAPAGVLDPIPFSFTYTTQSDVKPPKGK